jgi:hypothetical protein
MPVDSPGIGSIRRLMHYKHLVAALGLLMSGLSAQAVTQINALPFVISASGTYVVTANLLLPDLPGQGINVTGPAAGTSQVVIDLNGHTLSTSPNAQQSDGITVQRGNVTIKNGTLQNFAAGVVVFHPPRNFGTMFNINVENVTFQNISGINVSFQTVGASRVSNCTFNGQGQYGIFDDESAPTVQWHNKFDPRIFNVLVITTIEPVTYLGTGPEPVLTTISLLPE